jgi:hypothetical protein
MTPRRTEFAAFVLDLMDFIDGKVREALENEASRAGAIAEAGGAAPALRDRLRESEDVRGLFSLVVSLVNPIRWRLIENRAMLPLDVGFVQTDLWDGDRSATVARNA